MKPVFALIPFFFFAASPAVFAQTPPALEVRTAVGASRYLHGDLGYTAPTLLVALRLGRGGFVVEPEFAIAQHKSTETFGAGTTAASTDRFQSVAVNFLGRWGGDVSGFAGGGVGTYGERYEYELSGPQGYRQTRTQGQRLGAQLVTGVDIPVAKRIKIFGQARYEIRSFEDPGGGSVVQGFGGIAIGIF